MFVVKEYFNYNRDLGVLGSTCAIRLLCIVKDVVAIYAQNQCTDKDAFYISAIGAVVLGVDKIDRENSRTIALQIPVEVIFIDVLHLI